jgi:hypothetical protein
MDTEKEYLRKFRFITHSMRVRMMALMRISPYPLTAKEMAEYIHKPVDYVSEHLTDLRRETGFIKITVPRVYPSRKEWWSLNENSPFYSVLCSFLDQYIATTREGRANVGSFV